MSEASNPVSPSGVFGQRTGDSAEAARSLDDALRQLTPPAAQRAEAGPLWRLVGDLPFPAEPPPKELPAEARPPGPVGRGSSTMRLLIAASLMLALGGGLGALLGYSFRSSPTVPENGGTGTGLALFGSDEDEDLRLAQMLDNFGRAHHGQLSNELRGLIQKDQNALADGKGIPREDVERLLPVVKRFKDDALLDGLIGLFEHGKAAHKKP